MSLFERIKNKRYDLQEQDKPKQLTIGFDGEETKNTNNTSSGMHHRVLNQRDQVLAL